MADTLAQVQKDVRFWQRLLTFAGYKPGKVDGVNGRKTKAAAQEWQNDAERIKAEIGSFDERSERNIATLTPETQRAARIWLKAAKAVAEALGSKKASHLTLVLRARQAIELHKVPAMVEMTKTAIEEGQSVVLLVNFTETICALAAKLNCSDIICGGQSAEERQSVIDRFQRNEIPVVIANIQAGGVGVSLHDPTGKRSRLSIISPTFSAADLRQALGRVHRAGGAASIQKICFAAGTCEEHTAQVCAAKLAHIDLLNDGDMQPFPIQ